MTAFFRNWQPYFGLQLEDGSLSLSLPFSVYQQYTGALFMLDYEKIQQ